MYFLNGDRIYIKSISESGTLDDQLQSCLQQLKQINSGKKVFKLNFFVDTDSDKTYHDLQRKVKTHVSVMFSEEIVQSLIAQPPLTCKIIVEAFFYDTSLWQANFISKGDNAAILFRRDKTEILIGNVQANLKKGCKKNAEYSFSNLKSLFNSVQFPVNSIVRQWNYLEDILGFDDEDQHYQEFNNVRSEFYGENFKETGYPAATGIGMNRGGLIIEFVAVKSKESITFPVDNPGQIAAHSYSKNVLVGDECIIKTTPKFERARYQGMFGKRLIFISGTASIVGEKTVGIGNPAEQTEVTINNIRRLYSKEILETISESTLNPKYGHARVYIKHRKDFSAIKKVFKTHFGNLDVVYILADICRTSLLVEIEGKVVLE